MGSLLVLAVVLACGSSLDSSVVIGTWYLQSYNDSAMPGTAVFHSGNDSSLLAIDSVRLTLDDGSTCSWLVHLTGTPANSTDACVWTLDAGPDQLLVTVTGGFELRGSASGAALLLRDLNGNRLEFGRDPAERGPDLPTPARTDPGRR